MCTNPILAVSLFKNADDKHVLKFIPSSKIAELSDIKSVYGSNESFLLPCMKCKECREDYAHEWAIRCSLESYMHKFNYFLTLTFDNFHLPKNEKDAHHLFSNKFLKNLSYFLNKSNKRPFFFACVERGSSTNRLHLHTVLFLDQELELVEPVKIGDFYHFHAPAIEQLWPCGLHDITPFEHDCASYVAKYATKQGHCFMSRNLGKSYYLVHRDEIIEDDFKIYVDFNKQNFIECPKSFIRYFMEDLTLAFNDFVKVDDFKNNKIKRQKLNCYAALNNQGLSSESSMIYNKILNYLKMNKYSKERSDL